ncbi:hypothetical protein RDWZM_004973 [Blomia tropicalis]|uniref:Uncharacterized protein n=1 Tax=Blomia tropicalis TaxID=40697 RepID=A0A9Q0RN29_BLOTA|nr:hypothetical protein RDWZM_004973 [Blomia tropicalis]
MNLFNEKNRADQFYALYLGSTFITNAQGRNALKMAARVVLHDDQRILNEACEVSLNILNDHIEVKRKSTSNKGEQFDLTILNAPYHRVSACFILREDNKVVSIGVTERNHLSQAHIFMLTTSELASRMVTSILSNFRIENSSDCSKLTLKQASNEMEKPIEIKRFDYEEKRSNSKLEVPNISTCILDCYDM